jgi:hypothetical protein
MTGKVPGPWVSSLNIKSFNFDVEAASINYIETLKKYFNRQKNSINVLRDSVVTSLENKTGKEKYSHLKSEYANEDLALTVLDLNPPGKVTLITPGKIVMKGQPGFVNGTSKVGRAHFYAPYKMIGNIPIDTYWFDLAVVWIVSVLLYIALYYNLFRKLVDYLGDMRIKKSEA